MVHSFGTARMKEEKEVEAASFLPHQEKVNLEMFRAIETLGRKLERAESERDRLARRLALIESSATVDEKTGRLYLPVALGAENESRYTPAAETPRWMMIASLMSSAVAFFALGVVLFREPQMALTPKQIAILNSLAEPQMAKFDAKSWKDLSEHDVDQNALEAGHKPATPFLPGDKELAAEEKSAETAIIPPVDETAMASASVLPQSEMVEPVAPAEPTSVDLLKTTPEPITEHAEITQSSPTASKEPPAVSVAVTPSVKDEVIDQEKTAEKEVSSIKPEVAEAVEKKPVLKNEAQKMAPDKTLPQKLADLEKRAFDGVPEAQHDLATLYASGRLVQQNYKRAVYWFKQASGGDIANADYNLGVMYQQGLGVQKDLTQALDWYAKAADLGHPEAMYNLGIAYIQGIGTQQSIEKGVAFFKDAANAGVSQAAFNLGVLYESNFIGPINLDKALDWYQVAANEGHADAQASVDRLKKQVAAKKDETPGVSSLREEDLVDPVAGEETGEGDASPVSDDVPSAPAKKQPRHKN